MENLPNYVSVLFIAITFITVFLFINAITGAKKITMAVIACLVLVQGLLGFKGFFLQTHAMPPRFVIVLLPPVVIMILLFATSKGKIFIDALNTKRLVLLQSIRIGVELVLLALSIHKLVPQSMTFEGSNFDIFSGLTAPIIYYLYFVKNKLSHTSFIIWNCICLGLVLNVVINGILSTPLPFQQFSFEQPNVAVLYFPFVWLAGIVVPIVIFSHLSLIRRTLQKM